MGAFKDLTGMKFGRLTAVETVGKNKQGGYLWHCKCECGTECVVSSGSLISGHSISCGCLKIELLVKNRRKHGMTHRKSYNVWSDIKRRCFNPRCKNYKNYGGRGITMYSAWINDFQAFYNYVSKLPHFDEKGYSLDRINNDGNYEPDNVRWATRKEQNRNQRKNRFVEYNGETITVAELSEKTKISHTTLFNRLKRGEMGEYLFRLPRKK